MKNDLRKVSIKPILMGAIILLSVSPLMPNNVTHNSLLYDPNLGQSLDNIEDTENIGEMDPENPNDSSESTENTSDNNLGKNGNALNE